MPHYYTVWRPRSIFNISKAWAVRIVVCIILTCDLHLFACSLCQISGYSCSDSSRSFCTFPRCYLVISHDTVLRWSKWTLHNHVTTMTTSDLKMGVQLILETSCMSNIPHIVGNFQNNINIKKMLFLFKYFVCKPTFSLALKQNSSFVVLCFRGSIDPYQGWQ